MDVQWLGKVRHMKPIEEKYWQAGPLLIFKRVFERNGEHKTQWSFQLEGTLVVVHEVAAQAVIKGINGTCRWQDFKEWMEDQYDAANEDQGWNDLVMAAVSKINQLEKPE